MKEVLLVAKGKLMAVKAEGLKELAHRALQYGPSYDPDGVDLLAHRLLEFLEEAPRGHVVALSGEEDWLEAEALAVLTEEEIQTLQEEGELEELWDKAELLL